MAEYSYWEERSIQNELKADKYSQNQAKLITRFFNRAKKEMSAKVTELYKKYADKEGITLTAAKKILNDPELLATTLGEYYMLLNEVNNPEIKAYLDKLSAARAISREEFLKLQLNLILDKTYIDYEDITTSSLAQAFSEAYYKSQFDFDQFRGFGNNFNRLSINQIIAAVTTNWSGKNYSDRIWDQRNSLSRRINRIITTGMITGRSNKQMRQELEKEVDCSTYNARRLIRTESSYVSNEARALSYKQNGTKKYEYVATLDLLTSEICRELDGQLFDVKDKKVGINYPPMHPHCRSTTCPAVTLDEDDTRAARDENGNTYRVPASMKYKEWYEKHVANNPEALLQEKCLKNISADNRQFQKYQSILGKKMPKTLEDLQRMKYTDGDGWEDLKSFVRYKTKYPESSRIYYDIDKEIQELKAQGLVDKSIGFAVKPKPQKIEAYGKHALERMFERNFGIEDSALFINKAKVMFSQYKGTRFSFYSDDGVSVVTKSGTMVTGWNKTDFDDSSDLIMKVVDKYAK